MVMYLINLIKSIKLFIYLPSYILYIIQPHIKVVYFPILSSINFIKFIFKLDVLFSDLINFILVFFYLMNLN